MESSDVRVKDNRDDLPIFIHSELDDYGLSNAEFRVYGRLARRAGNKGVAKESVPNMASDFMVSDRTVRRCLQVLARCRLVAEHLRPGKPTEYALNPRKVWADKKELPAIRESVFGTTPDTTTPSRDVRGDMRDGGVPSVMSRLPLTPETGEGTPLEGTPKKVIPAPFASVEFSDALAEFEQHRKELRHKVTPTARKRLYAQLERFGEAKAIRALNMAVEKGWQGVFDPDSRGGNGAHPNAYAPGKVIV